MLYAGDCKHILNHSNTRNEANGRALTMKEIFIRHSSFSCQSGSCYSLLFPLFIAALLCMQPRGAFAYDFKGFTISGDERAGWVQYDYDNPKGKPDINKGHKDSHGFYIMPKLSIETPSYNNFRVKIYWCGSN